MTDEELAALVARLRRDRTDNEHVEAKRTRGKIDRSVWESVSAFANTDGGVLLLGVDEGNGFTSSSKFDVGKVQDQLVSGFDESPGAVSKVQPVPRHQMTVMELEGNPVIVVKVESMRDDPSLLSGMPCHVRELGIRRGSFKRVFDHDQRLSSYEIYSLQSLTKPDHTDRQAVSNATAIDINQDQSSAMIARLRSQGSRVADGVDGRETILRRLNVYTGSDEGIVPTFAGIMALGNYPQQFFPQLFIDVTVHPGSQKSVDPGGIRFETRRTCDGPMPAAIDSAVFEVLSNLRTRYREEGTGLVDEKEIPEVVVREAIANAVMHRDYSFQVQGQQIAVDVYPDRVEVVNPGGLWGDRTLENIAEGRSVSRNEVLTRLLSQILDGGGKRVAENQGSGIARMITAMRRHGLPAPRFELEPGAFKVILERFGLMTPAVQAWLDEIGHGANRIQDVALVLARDQGSVTPALLRAQLGLDSDDARAELQALANIGKLELMSRDRFVPGASLIQFQETTVGLGRTEREILEVVSESIELSAREIAAAAGKSVAAVRPHLRSLVEKNLVTPTASPTSRNRKYLRNSSTAG